MKNRKMRFSPFHFLAGCVILCMVIAGFARGPVEAKPVPSTLKAVSGATFNPDCLWQASAASSRGIGTVSIQASYRGCRLTLENALTSPQVCYSIFSVTNAKTWDRGCSGMEPWQTSDNVMDRQHCKRGEKLTVDFWMEGFRYPRTVQIDSREVKIVCGGGTWA